MSGPRRSAPGDQPATKQVTQKDSHPEGGAPCPLTCPKRPRTSGAILEVAVSLLFCWVEQVAEHPERGALFSRLHQQGQVVGHGPDVLYVRFAGEGQLISVPQLLRLLPNEPDERWW